MLIIIMVLPTYVYSQQADSLLLSGREIIGEKAELFAEVSEAGVDLSELTDKLEYLLENPLNINSADKRQLKQLGLLNDVQIKNMLDYRNKYGIFYSIYELRSIEGIGINTLEKIMPFVIVSAPKEKITVRQDIVKGKHELFFRYQRKLASQAGYIIPADSLQDNSKGSFYLGDPNRYYLRYRYKAQNKFSMGLTAEKDPGEFFMQAPGGISESLVRQSGIHRGFDFYSGHIEIKNSGPLMSLIVGDYHMQCGQGLVLWSGLSFGGGSDPGSFKRYAAVLKPSTSANENLFMRGIAGRIKWKKTDLSLFYSRKHVDANIEASDNGKDSIVSSLPEGGYHRTLNELADRNTLLLQHLGAYISHARDRYRLGVSACKTLFGINIFRGDEAASQFRFSGNKNFNAGLDFEVLLRKTVMYGEFGYSMNGGWAALCGLTHTTGNGSIFSILLSEYRKNYQNLQASAYGRRDGNANERSVRLGMELPLRRKLTLRLYTDHYVYPWLTTRSNNVFRGQDHELSCNYKPGRNTSISMKYRFRKTTDKSSDNLSWIDELSYKGSQKVSIRARHLISGSFSMKWQFEYVCIKTWFPEQKSKGSLLLFDIYYHPLSAPLKLSWRYSIFNTDDHDSRLYAYENDVLYASSMPAYSGKGFRTYLLISYKPLRWMQAWLRLSLTNYTDRNIISSGPEEIQGNRLPEIKVQIRIKL